MTQLTDSPLIPAAKDCGFLHPWQQEDLDAPAAAAEPDAQA